MHDAVLIEVEDLNGKEIRFILLGGSGQIVSKSFEILPQEVL